jgi:DNA-binding IclR family transcriptional regulator
MTTSIEQMSPIKPPREHSKAVRLLGLLKAGTGASLDDMIEATGWQPHTVRAALTGLRKRGYVIERHMEGSVTVWSLKDAAA